MRAKESGGGGEASWRFMATQTGTEDLNAAQGTAWYAVNLLQFTNATAGKLPYDRLRPSRHAANRGPILFFLGHWFFNHSSASSPKRKIASRFSSTSIQQN
jgi:hypothetical protein